MTRRSLADMLIRRCAKCGKPAGEVKFPGKGQVCNSCIAERSNAQRKARGMSGSTGEFARKLGLTDNEYAEYQNSACGICGQEPSEGKPNTAYQNRQTGLVVGAICPRCVSALGMFGHDADRVSNALVYLRQR